MQHEGSLNHDFVLDQVRQIGGAPRVLDFGCGTGTFLARARAAGFDVWGCDAYEGVWADWQSTLDPAIRPYIAKLGGADGDRPPYPDGHFDVIISNMVFEHIEPARMALAVEQIHRMLRPGGVFLALFPVYETWYEGHVGLYGPHYLAGRPNMLERYLKAMYGLGRGLHRFPPGTANAAQLWADMQRDRIGTVVVFHRRRDVLALWVRVFGAAPQSASLAYMQHRIARHPRLARFTAVMGLWPVSALLRLVCSKRASEVLLARRASSAGPTSVQT